MTNKDASSSSRYVLVAAVDASAEAHRVVDAAVDLANAITGAEIHLVHAVERSETEGFPVAEARDRAIERGRIHLDGIAQAAQARSRGTVVGHLRECAAATAILQTATSTNADLVMVGTHDRRGLARWAYGSVAERVTRDATCPVLVVRPKHHAQPHVPEVEPPCEDCLRTQRESKSAKLWCARHSQHHPLAHLHYAVPQGFGAGSGLVRP